MQKPKSFRPWEPDLERLTAEAMPRRGLARKADGTQTSKTQRNFTDANSHLMKGGGQRPITSSWPAETRTDAQGRRYQKPHGSQAEEQGRISD